MFGRGLGEKRMIQILKEYPDILISKESADAKIQKVSALQDLKQKLLKCLFHTFHNLLSS